MKTSLIKHKGGAPTKVTPEIETKLESIFKIGGTIAEATSYAGIGERTYYDRAKASPEFSQKMEAAKHYADIVAKNVVVDSILKDKDISSAKWWLEKRVFKDNSLVSVQSEKTVVVMPSTVISKYNINNGEATP
jgi:hypothetical protein